MPAYVIEVWQDGRMIQSGVTQVWGNQAFQLAPGRYILRGSLAGVTSVEGSFEVAPGHITVAVLSPQVIAVE